MTTQVINIHSNEHYDVYIGRKIKWDPKYHQSKWRNPFRFDENAPDKNKESQRVLIEFRIYLSNQPELLKQIHELKDKTLGCWCKPLPCHGDVLAEFVDADN